MYGTLVRVSHKILPGPMYMGMAIVLLHLQPLVRECYHATNAVCGIRTVVRTRNGTWNIAKQRSKNLQRHGYGCDNLVSNFSNETNSLLNED